RTFGKGDFIRVPLPPAKIIATKCAFDMKSILFKWFNFGLNYVMNSIQHSTIARSALGNPLELFKKVHRGSSKRPFLFIGGVHGDEPEGVALAEGLLAWLTEAEKTQSFRSWLL